MCKRVWALCAGLMACKGYSNLSRGAGKIARVAIFESLRTEACRRDVLGKAPINKTFNRIQHKGESAHANVRCRPCEP